MGIRYGFIFQGSICVITASESSVDTIWFVMVTSEEGTSNMEVKNYYGFIIQPGELFFKKKQERKKYVKANRQGNLHIYYCISTYESKI